MSNIRKELIAKANEQGLEFHKNITTEKLAEKLGVDLPAVEHAPEQTAQAIDALNAVTNGDAAPAPQSTSKPPKLRSLHEVERMKNRYLTHRRRRVIVTCLNPKKAKWRGEVIDVSNGFNGGIKMFVPFNNEKGWYVPEFILDILRNRKFVAFQDTKTANGTPTSKAYLAQEFSITELPELTQQQIDDLRQAQARTNRLED